MPRHVRFAIINAANGDNSIVAAVAGFRIRVTSYVLVSQLGGSFRWESGAGGTALSGVMIFGATGGVSASNPAGLFQTSPNEALSLEATADADGHLTYELV